MRLWQRGQKCRLVVSVLNEAIRFFAAVAAQEKEGERSDYEKENDCHCDPCVRKRSVWLKGYAKGPTHRSV